MNARQIYPMILEAALLGLCASIFMAYVALNHNPQQEFFDTESGRVVTENLLPVMLSWFAATAIAYRAVRLAISWLIGRRI